MPDDFKEDPIEERLRSSPLASLKIPSNKIPPYKGSPLSPTSLKIIRRNLARVGLEVLNHDLTTIDRLCDAFESEIHTLRSIGPYYLEELEEGDC